ncbi:MAG: NAD(P)H-dependent oxidoreductase [Gemmatimonadaceae bacterium]|nr:NAD(P)H-dependent oxidoreductase [Gemmatimonadaceae bacterium]
MLNILTISGSLRARSSNTEVLRAVALLAPQTTKVTMFTGLGELPHFNPDLDGEGATPPEAVGAFRSAVARADAILISSPEYAHGVPGALKNALDWLVSGTEIIYKPIGILNPSPQSTYAQAQLAETLRTMSTVVLEDGSPILPLTGRRLNAASIAEDPELAMMLRQTLHAIEVAVPTSRQKRLDLQLTGTQHGTD